MSNRKPRLPLMIDLETLSLKANAAVVDVAICPVADLPAVKRWLIRPESYTNCFDFDVSQETLAFHQSQKTDLLGQAEATGKSWRQAAQDIHDHLTKLSYDYEIHLWTRGKDADIPWLNNLLSSAGLKAPWRYNNTHCLRDLGDLFKEVKFGTRGNHTAASDTVAQVVHLLSICAYSDRAHNFVFGDNHHE